MRAGDWGRSLAREQTDTSLRKRARRLQKKYSGNKRRRAEHAAGSSGTRPASSHTSPTHLLLRIISVFTLPISKSGLEYSCQGTLIGDRAITKLADNKQLRPVAYLCGHRRHGLCASRWGYPQIE